MVLQAAQCFIAVWLDHLTSVHLALQADANSGGQTAALAAQCESLSRERNALRTILDTKVGVLVTEIQKSVAELPGEVRLHGGLASSKGCWDVSWRLWSAN